MAQEQKKLNSMRLLENQGIAYETFTYDPAITDGVHAAEAIWRRRARLCVVNVKLTMRLARPARRA